ncbi:MAG: hypothetical protein ACKV0T_00960 [Planctomycetales bacterium]
MLRTTAYEQVSSWLMAFIAGLAFVVLLLSVAWFATRAPVPSAAVPVELLELAGGVEDGAVDETLRVESPEPESADATPTDIVADEREVQESLDNVLELAEEAATQTEKTFELGTRTTGKGGSASGTGRRALGAGPGVGGYPREQRWYVRFGDQQNLDDYAKQLDFFKIEFGAIVGNKLVYVSNFSAAKPSTRTESSGADEKRLYMTWQGGGRKQADLQLFRKAGIDVGGGVIFQFYPKPIEDRLAQLELDYRKRKATEIRRTYFAVNRKDQGYEFAVIRQTLLR